MSSAAAVHQTDRARSTSLGILLVCLAVTTLSVQDVMMKVLVREVPIAQIVAIRFVAFLAFALAFAAWNGGIRRAVDSARPLLQTTRSAVLVIDILLFCVSIRLMGLAEFQAIYATAPLVATLLAGPILGEEIGWRRRIAVGIGLGGALIIIRPGMGVLGLAAVVALATTACWVAYNLMTRVTSSGDSLATSTLYVALTGTAMTVPFGIAEWQPLEGRALLLVVGVSATGIVGHMLFIRGFEHAPASVLQPFNYLLLAWAAVFGYVFFSELPDGFTILGASIIVASGLYVAWRERLRELERNRGPRPRRRRSP